jgi:hypothetical protein
MRRPRPPRGCRAIEKKKQTGKEILELSEFVKVKNSEHYCSGILLLNIPIYPAQQFLERLR